MKNPLIFSYHFCICCLLRAATNEWCMIYISYWQLWSECLHWYPSTNVGRCQLSNLGKALPEPISLFSGEGLKSFFCLPWSLPVWVPAFRTTLKGACPLFLCGTMEIKYSLKASEHYRFEVKKKKKSKGTEALDTCTFRSVCLHAQSCYIWLKSWTSHFKIFNLQRPQDYVTKLGYN